MIMNKPSLGVKWSKMYFVNSIEAWVPAYWANESLAILVENLQIAGLVYRDFENLISESGDTVNTRKPGEFRTKRKTLNSNITLQDVTATNIPVVLNQHLYNSFLIRDREQARAFQDLVQEYIRPAMIDIARKIDRLLLGQAPRFLRTDGKTAGTLGTDASVASILATRKNLNDNKVDLADRALIISSKDEAALLALDIFINASKVGDDGSALREASLGRRLGFNIFMCQNVCSVTGNADVNIAFLVNNASNYPIGTTTMLVKTGTGALTTGEWFSTTDGIPHNITGHSENTAGNTTSITFTPGLKAIVLNNAVITVYTYGQVNQSATVSDGDGNVIWATTGYPAGWEESIVYDTFTYDPQLGQGIQFAAAGDLYVIIDVNTTAKTILLDRPLVVAIADNAKIFPLPNGTYNFAFIPLALALVTRPMAVPRPGSGAVGAVANFANLSVRVVWAYDYKKQGTAVTVDVLCGVAVLESLKGEVMLT